MTHLGEALKKARGKMSQSELARKAGLDQSYISVLESGKTRLHAEGRHNEYYEQKRAFLTRLAELCKADPGILILAWSIDEGFLAFVDGLPEQGRRLIKSLMMGRRFPNWFWSAVSDLMEQVKR